MLPTVASCYETPMIIRAETPDDIAAIRQVHVAAFPSSAEADLVDRLRRDGDAVISLVAVDDDRVIGHALFSKMRAPFRALGLAPVAVTEEKRRQGVAAALIRNGIRQAEDAGWDAVFVLGDPAYYGRFGFSAEAAAAFDCPFAGPHFMLLILNPKTMPATGRVDYAPAFAALP